MVRVPVQFTLFASSNPVFTGSDLRELTGSLTKSLSDQIFTLTMNWVNATNFPETATHALDFGPGGLSGIGPLTARNLEGRGVRVIVIGDKAKGTAELFDAQTVKKEVWWKDFTPKLVKTRYVCYFTRLRSFFDLVS